MNAIRNLAMSKIYSEFSRVVPILVLGLIISCVFNSLLFLLSESNFAFGDGLSQEQISASMGSRKADLLIKMTPPVVTNETLQTANQKPIIQFRLFDSNTNKSFSHVNYHISIDKEGKKLLSNWFHSHDGDLGIEIIPSNLSKVRFPGQQQEPLIGGYIGSPNNPVIAEGPIFLNGGIYHFAVRIGTVDCDTCVLTADQQSVYNSYLSIGSAMNQQVNISEKSVPIKIISYYDKLNDFKFDSKNMQMQFNMPFNWNINRINNSSIFVHVEVYVPKPNSFTDKKSYSGRVNGIDVSKYIAVDPTNATRDIIHIMLPKNSLVQIASQLNSNGKQPQPLQNMSTADLMNFTLQPGGNATVAGGKAMAPMGSMGSMS